MVKETPKKFEILEHTTDVRVRVFGSSPKELFQNALYAMAYIQKPETVEQSTVGKLIGRIRGRSLTDEIAVESMDYNTLLVDFLSDVLSRSDAQNAVFIDVRFKEFSELKADGKIFGAKVDEFDKDIKAVTYHEVDVKEQEPGKWQTEIVFDI